MFVFFIAQFSFAIITDINARKYYFFNVLSGNFLSDFNDVSYYGEWKVMGYALDLLKDTQTDVDLFCELCSITGDKETVSRAFLDLFGVNHWITFDYGYNITVITIPEDIKILEITEKEGK